MKKEELSRLYWLNREIVLEQRRLNELRCAAEGTTSAISGLPHVKREQRGREDIHIALAELEELVALKIRQSITEYNRLARYIADVGDPMLREILRLRFINGLTWRQVAASIGGGNTEQSVKKACYRFLDGEK